jgi:hypothetical protein
LTARPARAAWHRRRRPISAAWMARSFHTRAAAVRRPPPRRIARARSHVWRPGTGGGSCRKCHCKKSKVRRLGRAFGTACSELTPGSRSLRSA